MIVADDERVNRRFVVNVLSKADWTVIETEDGDDTILAVRAHLPRLVIMDINMPRLDGGAATRAIRKEASPAASVPILAYTTMQLNDEMIRDMGMDGRVPKPCAPEVLVAAAARWRPDGDMADTQRLSAVFGADEMAMLVGRFRDQLVEAIDELDAGTGLRVAHRIAGVAGTLGFGTVSASWLKLSEGDVAVTEQARRDARIAIAQIDHSRHAPDPS